MPRDAVLVTRRVPLSSLFPDAANPRLHGEENVEAITASLRRFGQAEPLIVQRGTGRLIAGHGRLIAMKALGWVEADVVELDIEGIDVVALNIALNRSAEAGSAWNEKVLARLLGELRTESTLDGVGFSDSDLQELLDGIADDAQGEYDEDAAPEPMDEAVSRLGDVWVLGDAGHRVACGDSAKREDVERLLAGARIHLVNSDPPYGVRVEPRSNNAIAAGLSSFPGTTHHQALDLARFPQKSEPTTAKMRPKDRPLMNDFLPPEEFEKMLLAWFGNLAYAMEPGASFYIWGGYANLGNYPPALKASGLYYSQGIVWNKLHPVLTRKDFMGAFELAFYGWKEGAGHQFYGPNNVTDLWEVKKVNPQSMIHLTEKPVELAVRAIEFSSKRGQNVLDLFGGSGSTLMASEHLGRRGFLMELDPIYVDVIVRRFEQETGMRARLESTGQSFDEVAVDQSRSKASVDEPTPSSWPSSSSSSSS